MTDTFNIHAEVNRRIKAEQICRVMKHLSDNETVALIQARSMTKEQREKVAKLARVNPPSEDTWKIVVEMLEADVRAVKELKSLLKLKNRVVELMIVIRENRGAIEYFIKSKTGGKNGKKYREQLEQILEVINRK